MYKVFLYKRVIKDGEWLRDDELMMLTTRKKETDAIDYINEFNDHLGHGKEYINPDVPYAMINDCDP